MAENVKVASDGTADGVADGFVAAPGVARTILKDRGGSRCFTILTVVKTGSRLEERVFNGQNAPAR